MMTMRGQRSLLLCLIFALCTQLTPVFSLNIRFYEGWNHTGFYHEVKSFEGQCANVESRFAPVTGSVKSDTCLMVFLGENCLDYSSKILPGQINPENVENYNLFKMTYADANSYHYSTNHGVRSYFPCKMSVGGPHLNVDLYINDSPKYEYKDVCKCRNLPEVFHDKKGGLSADNHGNSFVVYTESDCQGESQVIPAGNNCYTRDFTNFKHELPAPEYHSIKSFGPDRNSPSYRGRCVKLTSTIFEFEFLDSFSEDEVVKADAKELVQKTVFKNNGSAKITQEYKVTKTIAETVEFSVVKALSDMHKGIVENKVSIKGMVGYPFIAEVDVKNELRLAYEYTHTSTDTDTQRNSTTTSREFSVRQLIEVSPCSEYVVSAYVLMLKDKPFRFKVHSKITGELGGQKMLAVELREHIAGTLEIIEDLDDYSVRVAAQGVMTSSFGARSEIDGVGSKIPGCEA